MTKDLAELEVYASSASSSRSSTPTRETSPSLETESGERPNVLDSLIFVRRASSKAPSVDSRREEQQQLPNSHAPTPIVTDEPTPTASPRVHFRTRVRITSGVHRHRTSRALGGTSPTSPSNRIASNSGGSSRSSSPSSSISVPLRSQADDDGGAWGPLGQRVSSLDGPKKKRKNGVALPVGERTPLLINRPRLGGDSLGYNWWWWLDDLELPSFHYLRCCGCGHCSSNHCCEHCNCDDWDDGD